MKMSALLSCASTLTLLTIATSMAQQTTGTAGSPVGSKLLTIKLARLWAEQGVPNSAIGKMVTTRPETITYLDRADLSALGASEGNPFEAEKSIEAGHAQQPSCATGLHVDGGLRRVP